MSDLGRKKRFLRILPGRVRMEVWGLQGNKSIAELLQMKFSRLNGIHKVEPCPVSGRLLLVFDDKKLDLKDIFQMIQSFEDQPEAKEPSLEVAAAAEIPIQVPEQLQFVPERTEHKESEPEKIPLSLALSMGGLAVLGTKRLLMGSSPLARSPAPFYLSALVSVVTGYPFLRRGLKTFSRQKKWNSDLLLGSSALALALVRENLIALAGMSILQYVNWRRTQAALEAHQDVRLSPEIQRYSEKASKIGLLTAGATWAITRNPLQAIAVMLATNPRPATVPAECAWNQAELVCKERNYTLPEQGSLTELVQTRSVLVEDVNMLFHEEMEEIQCISYETDAAKVISLAASLMEKSHHPWKEEIWNKAKTTCHTIRTAFHVTEGEEGIEGKINETKVMIGSIRYMQQHGINCDSHMLETKRMERKGIGVLFIAKEINKSAHLLGMLVKPVQFMATSFGKDMLALADKGWDISVLQNQLHFEPSLLSKNNIKTDWLSLEEGEIIERMAHFRQNGVPVLFVAKDEPSTWNQFFKKAGVPSVNLKQFDRLLDTLEYGKQVDQTVTQHFHIAKGWNIVGSTLATLGMLSAPVANLAADALSLVFLSRTKKKTESIPAPKIDPFHMEIAAASEAVQYHAVPWNDVTAHYQVHPKHGLSEERIRQLRGQFGFNQLVSKKPTPWLVSYLKQFKEFTTLILLGTSVLAFFTGGIFDGIAMGTVLLANAAISTIQERKAEKVVESLNQFRPPLCKVIREGKEGELSATELVPGDIVALEAGDRVPADIRVIQSRNLQVNESALTGESLPIEKTVLPVDQSSSLSERGNMLYMGTDISRGKGMGVVVETGMNTEMGKLMSLLKKDDKEVTPLQNKVTTISKKFIMGALLAGGLVFITGLLRGIPVTQMITTSMTLAASAIPEGLPVTITIALSAGIFRMAKKNALVRKLSALETLGRATVICSDKTGTLTKNEMTVKSIATIEKMWTVTGNGYEPIGNIEEASGSEVAAATAVLETEESGMVRQDHPELQRILQIGVICNNSKLEQDNEQWVIKGDPTEGALLTLAAKKGLTPDHMEHWQRSFEVPFDSRTGKMSVVCRDVNSEGEQLVFTKGSVETILRSCARYASQGQVFPMTEEQKALIISQNERLSGDALRVLAFAYRTVDANEKSDGIDEQDLIYVGMVGMIDPPKPDVEKSIREAYALGVKPIMITGDHPITAIAIAKQLGIYDDSQRVLSGHDLDRLSEEQLFNLVEDVSIFARVTPEHKLRIVTSLQKRGHIVVMTGDGVNDTPAIKQANVGIAMGRTGTEVTKETADMVLKEDHFATIVDGVKEGRTIISNIRKALGCLLAGNLAEIIVTSAAVMLGMPIPLVPIQILLMNLLTDAMPAMMLAVNPGNKTKETKRMDIVDKELYRKVITRGVLLGAGSLGLFAASIAAGAPIGVAQTVAFATLVAGQLMQTFFWRQEGSEETVRDWTKDRFLLVSLGVSWLALLAAIYVPPVAAFFHTTPLTLRHWLPILLVSGSVSLLSKPILSLFSRGKDQPASKIPFALAAA